MAVDTALKRFSIMNVSLPWRGIISPPDGTIGVADRQVYEYYYSSPDAEEPPQAGPSTGGVSMIMRHRHHGRKT